MAAPLAVVLGETAPQGATGQVTVQLTPRFELSLLTVAESCAVEPGCTVAGVAPMVTTGGCCTLLSPHPTRMFAIANPRSDKAKYFGLFKASLRQAMGMSRLRGLPSGALPRILPFSCPQHNDFPVRASSNREEDECEFFQRSPYKRIYHDKALLRWAVRFARITSECSAIRA